MFARSRDLAVHPAVLGKAFEGAFSAGRNGFAKGDGYLVIALVAGWKGFERAESFGRFAVGVVVVEVDGEGSGGGVDDWFVIKRAKSLFVLK